MSHFLTFNKTQMDRDLYRECGLQKEGPSSSSSTRSAASLVSRGGSSLWVHYHTDTRLHSTTDPHCKTGGGRIDTRKSDGEGKPVCPGPGVTVMVMVMVMVWAWDGTVRKQDRALFADLMGYRRSGIHRH